MLHRWLALCLLASLAVTGCELFNKEKVNIDIGGVPLSAGRVEKVYFDFNKYEIKGSGKKVLLGLVERMKADKMSTLLIVGHTDSRGTEEYNLALGERRANAVKEFILGCDRSLSPRISTQSRGKAEPEILVYSSDFKEAEKAHAQNRRVVLIMECQHAASPKKARVSRWPFSFGRSSATQQDNGGGTVAAGSPGEDAPAEVVEPEETQEAGE
ncbi:putative outer membrane protein OmpA [Anaplasma centrale str. Israel]|uniref:Putative outer membrane protein OmpA n=1 Tax=Anaplasma centrale (strain Israel) TaxID=574556 RepID=D1AU79_ANACI|nr:OmpA family protein [Anaplasma centrale]ACZ49107.1 putative outer membrane protein OmpA [Anaplasma centrale str. Israel]